MYETKKPPVTLVPATCELYHASIGSILGVADHTRVRAVTQDNVVYDFPCYG